VALSAASTIAEKWTSWGPSGGCTHFTGVYRSNTGHSLNFSHRLGNLSGTCTKLESPVMMDARRLECVQWRRGEGLGVRCAQDEEATNGRELLPESCGRPNNGPQGEGRPAYIYRLKRWALWRHCDAIQITGTVANVVARPKTGTPRRPRLVPTSNRGSLKSPEWDSQVLCQETPGTPLDGGIYQGLCRALYIPPESTSAEPAAKKARRDAAFRGGSPGGIARIGKKTRRLDIPRRIPRFAASRDPTA
jgi:hypothetical protein